MLLSERIAYLKQVNRRETQKESIAGTTSEKTMCQEESVTPAWTTQGGTLEEAQGGENYTFSPHCFHCMSLRGTHVIDSTSVQILDPTVVEVESRPGPGYFGICARGYYQGGLVDFQKTIEGLNERTWLNDFAEDCADYEPHMGCEPGRVRACEYCGKAGPLVYNGMAALVCTECLKGASK